MLEINLNDLDSTGLAAQAAEWRRRALRGEQQARGIAHALERELRRRGSDIVMPRPELDTRPLDLRQPPQRWWKLW
jgi:hypothetical protein